MTETRLGAWGVFERMSKVASILLVPILIWGVRVELFMGQGDRFTPKDAENLSHSIRKYVSEELRLMPPTWFRENVEELKTDVKANSKAIGEMRVEMNGRLRAIEALLRDG